MAMWSTQQHYLVLNVTRYYSRNSTKIFLEFQADMDQNPYCIPVTFTEETMGNTVFLSKKWIIFNLQQIGFYRVNYDDENWKLIARYLNSEQYTNIHVLNRAQIIDDSFHLMIQKKLNFSTFWELSSYLWQEKDYVAWYPMFKALEYMSNIIPFLNSGLYPSEVFKTILGKIKNLFERVENHMNDDMASIKYDIDKYLMQEIAKWSCIMNNTSCIEKARKQLRLHVDNPQENRILPGWQKWIYCNGLLYVNRSMWVNISYSAINIYKKKSDHKIFEFLSCSEDSAIVYNYLNVYLSLLVDLFFESDKASEKVKRNKMYTLEINIFMFTIARHVKNEALFKIILKNFNDLINSIHWYNPYNPYNTFGAITMNAALIVMINNAYSQKQLSEIEKFALNHTKFTLSIKNKLKTRSEQLVSQVKFYDDIYAKIGKT
ncbi:aminopeptidase N-like [Nylanderia fulva]|uniref:aminopeptidase N-like n=1 Tax=Nylanderia fulva TaxID=613905 RepID=UPI0010FB9764|nr:aminopeptidase N-like [Nylanderia fulva]